MYGDEFATGYEATQINYTVSSIREPRPDYPKHHQANLTDAAIFWIPIGSLVGCTVLFFALLKRWRFIRDEIALSMKNLDEVPCKKCRFFSGNHYLKCAVHPSNALTEKAINCSDYFPPDDMRS